MKHKSIRHYLVCECQGAGQSNNSTTEPLGSRLILVKVFVNISTHVALKQHKKIFTSIEFIASK